jgi:hypothetical protein
LAATLNKLFEHSNVPALKHLAERNRRKNA